MKECKSCNIKFSTNEELCPLCQNKLVGSCKETVFPTITIFKAKSLLLKILLFASLTIIILSSFIEIYITNQLCVTMFITGGLLSNYAVISYILKNRQNVLELIGKNGLFTVTLLICWYFYTKQTVLTNYVIPIICLSELAFNSIIFIILRKNYLVNYFKIIILNLILLLIPILLITLGFTTHNLLSYICFALALIVLSGMLIFYFEQVKEELKKIFNV